MSVLGFSGLLGVRRKEPSFCGAPNAQSPFVFLRGVGDSHAQVLIWNGMGRPETIWLFASTVGFGERWRIYKLVRPGQKRKRLEYRSGHLKNHQKLERL